MKENTYTNKLIAHRGYFSDKKGIPENSLIAFKRAIIFNYHIELDIVMLKDKNIVVFHDYNLKRMCNINKNINDLTYEEIKKLNLKNTKYKIPLLTEVLDLSLKDTTIFIDIKYNIDNKVLLNILNRYNYNYVILSFFPKQLNWFKKNKKSLKTGLLLLNISFNSLLKYVSIKPNFLVCNIKISKHKNIEKYRKKTILIGWTIKTKKDYQKYIKIYNNLICENMNRFF